MNVANTRWTCMVLIVCGLPFAFDSKPLAAGPLSASLSLEPTSGVTVAPGGGTAFDVFLRDYVPDDPAHAVISFALDISASDSALTGAGTDFTGFGFSLDSGLSGILGGVVFDSDISNDGRVEYGAETLLFGGTETGILASHGDLKLGTLSVVVPITPGIYDVALKANSLSPTFATFLLVDDGSLFGLTVPGDGTLDITNTTITVQSSTPGVPEPSSAILLAFGSLSVFVYRRRFR